MVRWTRLVVAHRRSILAAWLVLFLLGGYGAANLSKLLTNRFSVPGSQAERGLELLKSRLHQRGDGSFTLVVQATGSSLNVAERRSRGPARGREGARRQGDAGAPRRSRRRLHPDHHPARRGEREEATPSRCADAIGSVPGMRTYLTGFPALSHDESPALQQGPEPRRVDRPPDRAARAALHVRHARRRDRAVLFAFATVPTTLGLVWVIAHLGSTAEYVTNIVTLIGFAIAIDYSMLVVFRYREQLQAGEEPAQALETTMATAGRATLFSGLTVAIGLALLLVMPLPFIRSMGAGGVLIPLVSIAASATLLPALLSVLGTRVNSLRVIPRSWLERRIRAEGGAWARLAHAIMRHPVAFFTLRAGDHGRARPPRPASCT